MDKIEKLAVLAGAAKYDVSCSSSGSSRANNSGGLGNASVGGICHSWAEDGRCISLLKVLFSNICIYDCAYCVNRKSNDVPRAIFTVAELVDITINFYRRNYIEGLFLSSAVTKSPDYTMERLVDIARLLRTEHHYNGYIHLKAIPGASAELIRLAGLYADRLSVNIELPSENSLRLLAPEKSKNNILAPMSYIERNIFESGEERKKSRKAPVFAPAGQSTQLIVGASPETDYHILRLSQTLYRKYALKRVYYSAYLHVNPDNRLPALVQPPLLREHRLYQSDWLLRFYGFQYSEILSEQYPNLDIDVDPKVNWALRNMDKFPVEINRADYETLLRVPGIGIVSARRIVAARRHGKLTFDHLSKMGSVLKRARYFITCDGKHLESKDRDPAELKERITLGEKKKKATDQLYFAFADETSDSENEF